MRRLIPLSILVLFLLAACTARGESGGIEVIDVSGPLDRSALEFMGTAVEEAAGEGRELAVLQIDSRAALDAGALTDLIDTVESPPLPLAVWVGPAPAVAYGGVALVVSSAEHAAIAPDSTIGKVEPPIAGMAPVETDAPETWRTEAVPADRSGLDLQPTIRQYLQDLDGESFTTVDGVVTVETLEPFEDGVTLKRVTFRKPGLGLRTFRLAATPEAAFFFIVVGLTILTFEFYAIGPGVAAGVAAISLLIGGWGVVNLPVRGWALGLTVAGWALLVVAYQRGGVLVLTILGAMLLQFGGMWLVNGSGQIDARWYLVLPSVLAVLFFFLLAMPTVQRARFSTQTIGRETLVGSRGRALTDFDPDGVVEVDGARWRATAHREAGLQGGDEISVTGVDGLFLEVEPIQRDREN